MYNFFVNYLYLRKYFGFAFVFSLFFMIFFFGGVSYAATCSSGLEGKCGAAGGCSSETDMCQNLDRYQCVYSKKCDKAPTPIPTPSSSCSNINQCGGECGPCERCVADNSTVGHPLICQRDVTCAGACLNNPGPEETQLPTGNALPASKVPDLPKLISAVYNILFPAGILLGIAFIVKAGYEYMASEGDPNSLKVAQEDLTSAIIGILFVLFATVFIRIIISDIMGLTL